MSGFILGDRHPIMLSGLLAGLAMAGSAAGAQPPGDAQAAPATAMSATAISAPVAPSPATIAAPDMLFGQAPISEAELAATTGREKSSWMNASSSNNAIVSGNQVGDNVMTGDVNVTDSAFQNVSGISMVNFNTGNNSSINAAMSVNVHINFAPVAP